MAYNTPTKIRMNLIVGTAPEQFLVMVAQHGVGIKYASVEKTSKNKVGRVAQRYRITRLSYIGFLSASEGQSVFGNEFIAAHPEETKNIKRWLKTFDKPDRMVTSTGMIYHIDG